MNVDLEDLISDALFSDAANAPTGAGLLADVHARARLRSRRRLAVVGATAALVIAVGVAVVTALSPDAANVVPRPAPPAAADDDPLDAGFVPRIEFPVSPGWLPDGVSRTPRISLGDSGMSASYDDAARPQYVGIDIWSGAKDMTFSGDGTSRRATTHQGRPATLASNGESYSLGWQRADGTWLTVIGGNDWGSEAVVRRVAESLTDEHVFGRLPFELDLAPRDSEIAAWSTAGSLVFVRAGQGPRWRDTGRADNAVLIAARRATADLTGRGEQVTVDGHPGWLMREPAGRWTLVVQLPEQVVLVLNAPGWERADILRLGDAVHYRGGLPMQEG